MASEREKELEPTMPERDANGWPLAFWALAGAEPTFDVGDRRRVRALPARFRQRPKNSASVGHRPAELRPPAEKTTMPSTPSPRTRSSVRVRRSGG